MQSHANQQLAVLWPGLGRECPLGVGCSPHRVERARKHEEEGVAFGLQLTTGSAERSAHDAMVGLADPLVADPEALKELGRSLDVAEEKRDRTGRQVWLPTTIAAQCPPSGVRSAAFCGCQLRPANSLKGALSSQAATGDSRPMRSEPGSVRGAG